MAIEANTPKDWGMRGATNTTLPQFKGKSRQLIVNIDDGYRPIIMDGITLGGRFKCASLDEVATKLDKGAKAESAKVADSVNGANVSGTVANATNAVNATNATKATQDNLGRIISDTYATKGELEGIDTYASKEDIISAADKALNGSDPISSEDPTLDEIKSSLAGLQADIETRPIPNAYITKTWRSGSSWYRIWSDGWIEQGGFDSTGNTGAIATVTFSKAFTGINYFITKTTINGTNTGASPNYVTGIESRSTTKVTWKVDALNIFNKGTIWYACGY